MSLRLILKLAFLPLRRSWFLLTLMVVSFAQLMLLLCFAASIYLEIQKTDHYAQTAKFVTLQLKEAALGADQVLELIKSESPGSKLPLDAEELSAEEVLKQMETEEPEVVQTVRALGGEGVSLIPKVIVIRGEVPNSAIEKLKLMTEVAKVEVSPIHHARLKSFYRHLELELKGAFLLFLFLVLVQLLVFQRVQQRDLVEVIQNLMAWGSSSMRAKLPGAFSLFLLSLVSMVIAAIEWLILSQQVWKGNAFLGELSLNRSLTFPLGPAAILMLIILALSWIISLGGRGTQE
jgi:hypothetical protein